MFTWLTLGGWTFFGMMAVALTPTVQLASVLASPLYSLWNLMAGYIMPQNVRTSSPPSPSLT